MSLLRLANGDDYPEASLKHLSDAEALLTKQRPDGAAYLSGYVVECALKSLHFIETGQEYIGHDFSKLLSQVVNAVAMVAGAKTAKYLGRATSSVLSSVLQYWKPDMRYQAPSISLGDAKTWYDCAKDIYYETVHQMKQDGVI